MKKKPSKAPRGRSQLDEYAKSDSDNELDDLFASGADRVGLSKNAADSDDELDEEAVYDMDDEVWYIRLLLTSIKVAGSPQAACMA